MKSFIKIALFTLIALLCCTEKAEGQIEHEILNFVDSSEVVIRKGKTLLFEKVMEGDIQKANDIFNYILSKTDHKSCSSFSFTEELYLNIYLENWDYCGKLVKNVDDHKNTICYPSIQNYEELIMGVLHDNVDLKLSNLATSQASDEQKSFFKLYLSLFKNDGVSEEYGELLKTHKTTYPSTEYTLYAEKYLPSVPIKGSMGFSMGYAYLTPTGNLQHVFNVGHCFSMSMDINVNKVYTSLYLHGGSLSLKKDFTYKGIDFYKGEDFSYIDGGLKVGLFVRRSKRFHLAPYALIGGTTLQSDLYAPEDEMEDEEIKIINAFTSGLGVHTEFKIATFTSHNMYGYYDPRGSQHHVSIKCDFGYNVPFQNRPTRFSGNMMYLNASLVWAFGDF